jgi:uncharacterized membrane protein YgcG
MGHRRTLAIVRYVATALLCVVAAFGAAFLVRRAVDHGAPVRGTVASDNRASQPGPTPGTPGHAEDTAVHHRARGPRLSSEFAPGIQRITRKHRRPRHRQHHHVASGSGSSAPSQTTGSSGQPTYTQTYTQTYTPPATTPPPATHPSPTSGGSSSGGSGSSGGHKSSGSGTGTTSIGGSGKGSGTTTIG